MGVWPLNIKVLPQGRYLARGRGLAKRKKGFVYRQRFCYEKIKVLPNNRGLTKKKIGVLINNKS